MILRCTCENEFQDKVYGPSKRVHNAGASSGTKQYVCTACGATQTKGGEGNHPKGKKALAAKKVA